eukprot:7594532-Pyramimonas_sp.AAC.1
MLESWLNASTARLTCCERNNETFVHSEAYDGLCVASNGEAWLADQFLQDSAERPVLSAEYVIPNWAQLFIARRERTVSGEPKTIAGRA